jgi:repressor LexA
METLTRRQIQVYDYLKNILGAGKPPPSIAELSQYFGFRSSRSARDHLKALERKGLIIRDANKARSIRVVRRGGIEKTENDQIPLLGSIAAGYAENQVQDVERYLYVDRQSLGFNPIEKCFALRVTGDSMVGKGIYDGDIVIVDGMETPRSGNVVVALIDNESTLKTLIDHDGKYYLKPENENYPEITPVTELAIQGVVKTIIRNLG